MRWIPGGRSTNVEDRRGESTGPRRAGMNLGIGGMLVLLVLSAVFHKDFFALLGQGGGGPATTADSDSGSGSLPVPETSAQEEQLAQFVSFVLDDVQQTWVGLAPQLGTQYEPAKLVLFRDAIDSGCGIADAASGPFYCTLDQKVYVDLGFYDQLRDRFGAPGDFAQAYVIAHELGHHVQDLTGVSSRVQEAMRANPGDANELSVRLELQADCYAGVWGHAAGARGILESGDLEEGLNAAAAIGDDRIQKMTAGHVMPEAFTHGTSAQRLEWFRRGLETGRCEECDTFQSAGR